MCQSFVPFPSSAVGGLSASSPLDFCITAAAAAKDRFLLIVKCEMNDDGRVSHEHIDAMTSLRGERVFIINKGEFAY